MDKHMEKTKRWNALRLWLLTATAVMLVMSAVMGTAWAFFSTYARAKGGITIHLGHEETVEEEFSGWQKKVSITSTADSRPVYIRARGFCADYGLTYNSESWGDMQEDGWVYYQKVLPPGQTADPLFVQILDVPSDRTVPDAESFNVIIVYETTEIQYAGDGSTIAPEDADWNRKVDTYRTGKDASAETSGDTEQTTQEEGGES